LKKIYNSNVSDAETATVEPCPAPASCLASLSWADAWAKTELYLTTRRNIEKSTIRGTYYLVKPLVEALGGFEVSQEWADRAIKHLKDLKRSEGSINTYMSAVKRVYNAHGVDVITKDIPGSGKIVIPVFETVHVEHYHYERPDQCEQLIRSARSNTHKAMIAFFYYQGVRNGELINLTMDNLDLKAGTVRVYGQKNKKWRTIPINPKLMPWFNRYLEERRNVFVPALEGQGLPVPNNVFLNEKGKAFGDDGPERAVMRAAERAGFDGRDLKEAHPHTLRHSIGYQLLHLYGWPITEVAYYLGDRVGTIERYYSHTGVDDCKRLMSRMS